VRCSDGTPTTYCGSNNDCNPGLTCVNSLATYKYCSNLNLGSGCDITTLKCNPGLTCEVTVSANDIKTGKCIAGQIVTDGVECGNVDSNGDKKINITDFAKFARLYSKTCK